MLSAKICPSLLSGDFARLAEECQRMLDAGADYLHMGNCTCHFVPNLTMGAPVIKWVHKNLPEAFLDCHMMISEPEKLLLRPVLLNTPFTLKPQVAVFSDDSADAKGLIAKIKKHKVKVGIAIRPGTPVEQLIPFCHDIDLALVMAVDPGFGGQPFMGDMMEKVKILRTQFPALDIQVDGGLNLETTKVAAEAGANVIVAGTSIFSSHDPKSVISQMRNYVNKEN